MWLSIWSNLEKKSFSRKKEKLSPPFFLSLYKREVISRFFSSSSARRTSVLLCLIYIFHRLIVIAWILFSISLYKRILVVPLLLDVTKLSLSLSVMPCMSAFEICCCVADSVIQTIMLLTSKLMKCKWNNTRRHVVWFFLFWYLFVVLWKNNRCNIKMFYDDISSINQLLN